MKKKKHSFTTIILVLVLLIGLSLLLYPSFSNWWNSFHQSHAIASYQEQIASMDEEQYQEIWEAASAYNQSLLDNPNSFVLTEEQQEKYEKLLNIGDNGIMGYIEIPAIDVMLPIYHGTAESVLQMAVGHLEWTSLPVGGESSHCVLSGHRGLPSAKLFTDLDQLEIGEVFILRVLDEELTYEVDQIRIVLPKEVEGLMIQEGEDLCTLVTCTPYGINTHRILIRGHRIDNLQDEHPVRVTGEATQISPKVVAPFLAVPILLVLIIMVLFPKRRK